MVILLNVVRVFKFRASCAKLLINHAFFLFLFNGGKATYPTDMSKRNSFSELFPVFKPLSSNFALCTSININININIKNCHND